MLLTMYVALITKYFKYIIHLHLFAQRMKGYAMITKLTYITTQICMYF